MCLGLLSLSAGLAPDLREGSNDLSIYRNAGEGILRGLVPYRDFFIEYPPGSLPAFVPPAVFSADRACYIDIFSAEMAIVLAATLLLTALTARRLHGPHTWLLPAGTFAASGLLLYPVAVTRYDAVVALTLALAALCATLGGRYLILAYASLGVGAAAKLVPALATLPLVRKGAARGFTIFFAVVALFFAPFLLVGGGGILASFAYQANRGLQVESLAASVLMERGWVHGVAFEYGAFEVRGYGVGLATSLSPLITIILLAVTGFVMYREYRRSGSLGGEAFPRYAAALILAFMLGSKVLSPQYMIWILPLVPLSAGGASGLGVSTLFITACFATTQVFPIHYGDLLEVRYPGPDLLFARNLLLAVLWVLMLLLPNTKSTR
ncbi:MAG TPA: glycosyltransferase 87 family protein [Rubrobacter sp.]|nr:glycosyltransferase 87 family protein [Rubrobacter sp.]